ncbi:MAG: nitroreductase [Mycobacterium sp.]|nr:nitroreductase [Mycobacterium sp.]
MPTPPNRLAVTSVPVHPDIAARWSPRAFDPENVLGGDDVLALLEAARWAATWGARQPVRFLVGLRGDQSFDTLTGLLRGGNSYASAADALILVCVDDGEDEGTALYAAVDAGAAMANLSIEAVARGVHAHPMAGFDVERAGDLTPGLRPLAIVAVGRLADYAEVSPEILERDSRPRTRLPLEQVVLNWPL